MKLIKFLFFAILISSLTACNSDDDLTNDTQIEGTWKVTEIHYEGTSVTNSAGVTVETMYVGDGVNMDLEITFDSDQTFSSEGDYGIDLTATVSGQSFPVSWTNIGFQSNGTWEFNDPTLSIVDSSGESAAMDVIEVSETQLKFMQTISTVETQNGASVTQDIDATFTFEKL